MATKFIKGFKQDLKKKTMRAKFFCLYHSSVPFDYQNCKLTDSNEFLKTHLES